MAVTFEQQGMDARILQGWNVRLDIFKELGVIGRGADAAAQATSSSASSSVSLSSTAATTATAAAAAAAAATAVGQPEGLPQGKEGKTDLQGLGRKGRKRVNQEPGAAAEDVDDAVEVIEVLDDSNEIEKGSDATKATTLGEPEGENVSSRPKRMRISKSRARTRPPSSLSSALADMPSCGSGSGDAVAAASPRTQARVPNTFASYADYRRIFEPLAVQEIRANLLSDALATIKRSPQSTRARDDWQRVNASVSREDTQFAAPSTCLVHLTVYMGEGAGSGGGADREGGRMNNRDDRRWRDKGGGTGGRGGGGGGSGSGVRKVASNDVVLLSPVDAGLTMAGMSAGYLPPIVLGVARSRSARGVWTVLTAQRDEWDALANGSSGLVCDALVVTSLVSSARSYKALDDIQHCPLLPQILSGQPPDRNGASRGRSGFRGRRARLGKAGTTEGGEQDEDSDEVVVGDQDAAGLVTQTASTADSTAASPCAAAADGAVHGSSAVARGSVGIPGGLVSHIHATFNPSQASAILASCGTTGIGLVQGPPGTGKTTTLLGLLNALHAREYQRFYEEALSLALTDEVLSARAMEQRYLAAVRKKPHILVCGPSNASVDNIVERLFAKGFLDGTGQRYNPQIVRVGRGRSSRVESVALGALVKDFMDRLDDTAMLEAEARAVQQTCMKAQQDVAHWRQRLLVMKAAIKSLPGGCSCLPLHIELRVQDGATRPFYVDHSRQTTSYEPPPEEVLRAAAESRTGRSLQEQPEWSVYVGHLVNRLEEFARHQLQLKRIMLLLSLFRRESGSMVGGGGGVGGRGGGGGHGHQNRHQIEDEIAGTFLDNAHMVFTTLNSAAGARIADSIGFSVVVVDEAAQAVETETLIPLRSSVRHCLLIGDPRQLSATTFAQQSKVSGFHRSLFERMMEAGVPVHLLSVQYRMHPQISLFPNAIFYDGRIADGPNVQQPLYHRWFHYVHPFGPFRFFSLRSEHSQGSSASYMNQSEAMLVMDILTFLLHGRPRPHSEFHDQVCTAFQLASAAAAAAAPRPSPGPLEDGEVEDAASVAAAAAPRPPTPAAGSGGGGGGVAHLFEPLDGRIVVITPYSEQVALLHDMCRKAFGSSYRDTVSIGTVDGFQGQERDVVIFSCVRASPTGAGGIGFLRDKRRLNVALTRAKYGLFVVGDAEFLAAQNELWDSLVRHAAQKGSIVDVPRPGVDLRSLQLRPPASHAHSRSSSRPGSRIGR